ncbi:hypothetical protein HD806DRAFT_486023 [Xylariaceae sp. AK1471]|nr:hypothetical protein HD806DRAFT_486023 [Xylariaceae sp. AK1471]
MSSCKDPIIVTSQADIDHGALSSCEGVDTINIRNATGTLSFPSITSVDNVTIQDTRLDTLDFPILNVLRSLEISPTGWLVSASLPLLQSTRTVPQSSTELVLYPDEPTFLLQNATFLEHSVFIQMEYTTSNLDALGSTSYVNHLSIETDGCLGLFNAAPITSLYIYGKARCSYGLDTVMSIDNFTLINAVEIETVDPPYSYPDQSFPASLQVNGTMILEYSLFPIDSSGYIGLRRINTIGGDLNITSNGNAHIAYDGLTDVGASLSIRNNTNCAFNFKKVSTIGDLLFVDNIDTTLPLFPYLERVNNVHVRGLIDTSVGPNIFPALKFTSGNVTIEAWNDDFDCSKLVAQWNDHNIHNLQCNGTNNGTVTSNHSLSQGAWAGIGVGASLVIFGIVAALIWLIIHFRRRLRKLERTEAQGSHENELPKEPEPSHIAQTQEMDGKGTVREKPDDHVVEMPTQPTELPTSPQNLVEPEETNHFPHL